MRKYAIYPLILLLLLSLFVSCGNAAHDRTYVLEDISVTLPESMVSYPETAEESGYDLFFASESAFIGFYHYYGERLETMLETDPSEGVRGYANEFIGSREWEPQNCGLVVDEEKGLATLYYGDSDDDETYYYNFIAMYECPDGVWMIAFCCEEANRTKLQPMFDTVVKSLRRVSA